MSAALQLVETLGIAVFAGAGGALIALGLEQGWAASAALAAIFAAGACATLPGLAAARRASRGSR